MWSIGLYAATLLAICFIYLVFKKRNPRNNNQVVLPPGSKSFPFIGETLQLIMPSYSLDLPHFITSRVKRYGPIFQTRIVGRPVVVSADMGFNRYLARQEGSIVEVWYLDTFSKLFALEGEGRISAAGIVHKYLRSITLTHFGSELLRDNLVPQLEDWARKSLQNWSTRDSIEIKEASLKMNVELIANHIFGYDEEKSKENLGEKYSHITKGLFSFPINIPGTTHHKCLKNHREVIAMMRRVMRERQASPETYRGDFLDHALKDLELKQEKFLTEDFILHLMYGLVFAGSESTSMTLTLIFVFLSENPHVLAELEAEHEQILKRRSEAPNSPLTWSEVKSMSFTLHVINESLRLGNHSFGLLRKASTDIPINGYTIPAGWTILMVTSADYYNPNIYEDPFTFNPWRWEKLQQDVISKTYMPFGAGARQCAGAEYAKVLLTIILHVIVTKYMWKKIKGGKMVRTPMLGIKDGFHIKLTPKDN